MNAADNHFQIFDLPVSFDVDLVLLAERYRGVQRILHPDNFVNAGERERRLSVQSASQVNDAYKVLKSPLLRAKYLLKLRGIDIEQAAAKALDGPFLMEQMDLRESLAAVRNASELDVLAMEIEQNSSELLTRLRADLASAAVGDLSVAVDLVRKLQFYDKLREEIHVRAADLEFDNEPR